MSTYFPDKNLIDLKHLELSVKIISVLRRKAKQAQQSHLK